MEPRRAMITERNYPEIAGTQLGQMINIERKLARLIDLQAHALLDEKELLKELRDVAEYTQKSILQSEQELG